MIYADSLMEALDKKYDSLEKEFDVSVYSKDPDCLGRNEVYLIELSPAEPDAKITCLFPKPCQEIGDVMKEIGDYAKALGKENAKKRLRESLITSKCSGDIQGQIDALISLIDMGN